MSRCTADALCVVCRVLCPSLPVLMRHGDYVQLFGRASARNTAVRPFHWGARVLERKSTSRSRLAVRTRLVACSQLWRHGSSFNAPLMDVSRGWTASVTGAPSCCGASCDGRRVNKWRLHQVVPRCMHHGTHQDAWQVRQLDHQIFASDRSSLTRPISWSCCCAEVRPRPASCAHPNTTNC